MTIRKERGATFDEVAEIYDRTRPGYSEALIEDVLAFAGLSARARILDVGCGTGQATVPFAERGYAIVALEPGPNLARIARKNLARFENVEVVQASFEDWTLEPKAFDLVISAQAFHWVDPDVRFVKAASALRGGGTLAIFGHVGSPGNAPERPGIDRAYAQHAPGIGTHPGPAMADELAEAAQFGAVTDRSYPWTLECDVPTYLDFMRTQSSHRLLPPDQLERLLEAIGEAIEAHGDTTTTPYLAALLMARRG